MTALRTAVLDLVAARDLAFAGGKAVNLAELIGAGFPVPDGFCVGTPAYAQAAAMGGLDAVLAEPGQDLARRARAALLATSVPAEVAAAVTDAYAALGDRVPVAVRSSATAEDLPGASFAGQQDTYLNVVGVDAVLEAVRRCWASLWTDRAVAYRADVGIPHAGTQLAVVVQRMVDAQVAGVLFTADPISGKRTRSVLDAAPGLGDAVVSGAVDPDHWVVDGRVITQGPATTACLADRQVRDLVDLGRRVEALFGAPQDIEWALDREGALWLTQSRAITTLYPVPPSPRPGLRVHLNATLAQGLTRPITPMGLSAFRVAGATLAELATGRSVDPMVGPAAFGVAGGRGFVDVTAALRNPVGRRAIPLVFDVMESRSAVIVRGLLADEPTLAQAGPVWSGRWRAARPVLRVLLRYRVPGFVALALVRPAAARGRVAARGEQVRARVAEPVTGAERARFDHVIATLRAVIPIMPTTVPAALAGFLALGLARRVAGPDLDAQAVHAVLRGLPHNVTTDMDLALWALATRLDPASVAAAAATAPAELAERYHAGALPPVLQRELAAFLAEHGHRTAAEIDLGMPRWSDDPTQVLGSLANYLRITDPAEHPDVRFARAAAAAEAAVDEVVAGVRRRSRVRARITRFALGRTRQLAGMRETHKDYLVRLLAHARAPARDPRRGAGRPRCARCGGRRLLPGAARGRRRDRRPGGRRGPARRGRDPARRVRPGAAPPPHPTRAAVGRHRAGGRARRTTGRRSLGRHRGVGGHRHGRRAGGPRSGRRPARAGRDPRRPLDRPGVDTALPHRGRPGHGDGRGQLPRGGRRAGVRHPGGCRRGRRREPSAHRPDRHGRRRRGHGDPRLSLPRAAAV